MEKSKSSFGKIYRAEKPFQKGEHMMPSEINDVEKYIKSLTT